MKKILIYMVVLSTIIVAGENYGHVNGDKITDKDVQVLLGRPIDLNMLPQNDKKKIIDQIVKRKLLVKDAMKSGVANKKEFKEALNDLKEGLLLEYWMQQKMKKIKISYKEQKDFYNKNRKSFTQKEVLKARHILLDTQSEAKDLINKINKSSNKKSAFIAFAKSHSKGPSGKNGGDLGWFEPKSMVPEFSKAASKLKKGTYSKVPVKTNFGYHIIYLEDKKSRGVASFDDSKIKIQKILAERKLMKVIDKRVDVLKKTANISIK